MNPHEEVGEPSLILHTCENRGGWLNTLKLKLTVIHHQPYISLFQEEDMIRERLLIKNQTLSSFVSFRNYHAKTKLPDAELDFIQGG